MIVTCYLDESATDGGTPKAVVGGLQMNESHFMGFDSEWREMLCKFSLSAIHMKDFGAHGARAQVPIDKRRAIFHRAVQIIADHNICTMAVTVDNAQFRSILPNVIRQNVSLYSLAFMGCVVGNHLIAKANGYAQRVSFVMDTGNPYAKQVLWSHAALTEVQKDGHFLNLGSITFDDDERLSALQAADIICWAVRRRATGYPLHNGFEPIKEILDARGHNQSPVPEDSIRDILAQIRSVNPEILE